MSWASILGTVLLFWAAWELFTGRSWLHREFRRDEEPVAYWAIWVLWMAVAISCFYWV